MRLRWPRQEGSDEPVRIDLGWLGGILVVAAIGGVALYLVVRSPNAEARQVRGYFASQQQAPRDVLRRLHVKDCAPYPDERGLANYRCTVDFDTQRFKVCFGFGDSGVERGPAEFGNVPGCQVIAYKPTPDTIVLECPARLVSPGAPCKQPRDPRP